MKQRGWIPYLIVLIGICLLATGLWQLLNGKIQTHNTLIKVKKELIIESQKTEVVSDQNKKLPSIGDTVGLLEIPKINAELPIVEGTNEDDLEKGVGHFKGSFFPGENGQIVLSGHRDTVFRHLGKLNIGDVLTIKIPNGTYSYGIYQTKIVDAADSDIITLQNTKEELILTTCYPFNYIGNAPKRYIIYAKPK